jgi:HSP20 family protein
MVKKKRVFGDDFPDFEGELERMRKEMEELMEEMMGSMPEEELEKLARQNRPGVYGFSIKMSGEGKPIVREFGNVKPEGEEKALISDEREPLVDVIEGKGETTVIVELPGVDRKDILAKGEGRTLVIIVNSESRKYYKELELPSNADFSNARAKCNNGVLELVLQKDPKGSANSRIVIN